MDSRKLVALRSGKSVKRFWRMSRTLFGSHFILGMLLFIVCAHVFFTFSGIYWSADMRIDSLHIDKVLHMMGGFWVALLALYMGRRFFGEPALGARPLISFVLVLGIVALVGIIWELFEFSLDVFFASSNVPLQQGGLVDTMIDLIFDLLGGSLATFFCIRGVRRIQTLSFEE